MWLASVPVGMKIARSFCSAARERLFELLDDAAERIGIGRHRLLVEQTRAAGARTAPA